MTGLIHVERNTEIKNKIICNIKNLNKGNQKNKEEELQFLKINGLQKLNGKSFLINLQNAL